MDAKSHVPNDLTRLRFRANAYSNLYFSWNNHTSSTPNALPSYWIHQSSNSINLPDVFDARVMKMHYLHPHAHKCVWQLGSTRTCWGSLSAPRLPSRNGKRMGKRKRGGKGVGSRNITFKGNNFVRKEKEQGTNCKLFRLLKRQAWQWHTERRAPKSLWHGAHQELNPALCYVWRLFSSISLMRSACIVRTRFILNNFQWDWIGDPRRTQGTPLAYAHASGYLFGHRALPYLAGTHFRCHQNMSLPAWRLHSKAHDKKVILGSTVSTKHTDSLMLW